MTLVITYRKGRFVAAYLHLAQRNGRKSARTEKVGPGLILDFDVDGTPLGLEITEPEAARVEDINRILGERGHAPIAPEELTPLAG